MSVGFRETESMQGLVSWVLVIQWVLQASVMSEHRRQCLMHYARRRQRRLRTARLMWCSEATRCRSPTDGLATASSQTPASSWRPADHSAHRRRTRIHNASLKASWVVVPRVGTWSDSTYNVSWQCHCTLSTVLSLSHGKTRSSMANANQYVSAGKAVCDPDF